MCESLSPPSVVGQLRHPIVHSRARPVGPCAAVSFARVASEVPRSLFLYRRSTLQAARSYRPSKSLSGGSSHRRWRCRNCIHPVISSRMIGLGIARSLVANFAQHIPPSHSHTAFERACASPLCWCWCWCWCDARLRSLREAANRRGTQEPAHSAHQEQETYHKHPPQRRVVAAEGGIDRTERHKAFYTGGNGQGRASVG
jgi:hypothetical protein